MTTEVFSWREAPPGDYGVIGDPIAHTKSPAMHAAAYRALGLDLTYRAIHVPVGEVPQALERLRDLGYRGVNVTVPHKESALAWASEPDHQAREIGAANTLDFRTGRAVNTDVFGFTNLLPFGSLSHGRVLILGAGGTSAALVYGLLFNRSFRDVTVWNRNPARAVELLAAMERRLEPSSRPMSTPGVFDRNYEPESDLERRRELLRSVRMVRDLGIEDADLIVNATPASLRGDDLGIDWHTAKPGALAYELAYGVDDAPFLRGAREAGLPTRDGRDMLAGQGAMAFALWDCAPSGSPLSSLHLRERADAEGMRLFGRELLRVTTIMREALG